MRIPARHLTKKELPETEIEELARRIADKITVNWLGETGCTPEYAEENAQEVAEVLREYLGGRG